MKTLLYTTIYLLVSLSTLSLYSQSNYKTALTKAQVTESLKATLESSQKIIQWKNVDDHLLWSTLNAEDQMASIGYSPAQALDFRSRLHEINFTDPKWTAAKNKIIDFIVSETQKKYGKTYTRQVLMPKSKKNQLPYLSIKIMDRDIMEAVMAMPEVRFLEPKTTPDFSKQLKSDSGCSSGTSSILNTDYTTISPQSIQSWHHDKHNIPCAWMNSDHGNNIWIAVMDTGISSSQDKLNGDFDEGDSAGRVVEKYNTFQTASVSTSNWQDQCGHGTSMAGLATAPRGNDFTPAGVAYEANLISYRVTEDVLINTGDEKDGLSEALYHAANDPRVNVISMSIGDVFSSGQVELAIQYAYSKGKLMFAAAGTSTTLTNWYPVIFPAWMIETVAVTGVTDAASRERCSTCHDGPEVDFVIEMQRASSDSRTAVTVAVPNLGNTYVGGSSAATATTAGIAGLVWGENPNWSRTDVLTRMIQSADNYPTRNNDFGWGAIDACDAVDNNFSFACSTGVTNDVTMQITNISFPAESDSGSEAEWVVRFNGAAHFFNVDEDGDSGDPVNFIDTGVCGNVPIIIPLGTTSCNESSRPVTIAIHEDDGLQSDCTLNGFPAYDNDFGSATRTVSFNSNTFSFAGLTFTYQLVCASDITPPAAGLSVPQDTCINSVVDVEFFASGGVSPYTVTYTANNGPTQTLSLDANSNSAAISHNTNTTGTTTYTLLSITDADDCGQTLSQSESVTVHPLPTIAAAGTDPSTCGGMDGSISITVTNVPNGTYDISYAGGAFTNVTINAGSGIISGLAASSYTDLTIMANTCESTELPAVVLSDPLPPVAGLTNDSPSCFGDQVTCTATPSGMANYEFFIDANNNGVPDGGESLQSGSADSYSSSSLSDGDVISIQITNLNCTAEASTIISVNPIPQLNVSSFTDPTDCGGVDGIIEFVGVNVPDGNYMIESASGPLFSVGFVNGIAIYNGLTAGTYTDLFISVNGCESIENDDVVLTDPTPSSGITIASDSPQCPGMLTTIEVLPAGMADYTFFNDANNNGMMDASEQLQSGPSNLYGSTALSSGDVIGVVTTEANACQSTHMTVITLLPPDYAFNGSGGLTGVELGIADYETDGILESTQTIDFSSVVDYDSAIEVHLLPGFETVLGAQFEAFIDGCNGGLGGQN